MKSIHHLVDINAPTATIWAALTAADGLTGWWGGKLSTPEAAVGALLQWTFSHDFNPVMEIVTLDEPRELVWRCVAGHDPWKDSTFRFLLEGLSDGRTRLRFWQEYTVEPDDNSYGVYNFNWGYYLESLNLYCSTGAGKPFQPPA